MAEKPENVDINSRKGFDVLYDGFVEYRKQKYPLISAETSREDVYSYCYEFLPEVNKMLDKIVERESGKTKVSKRQSHY